MRWAPPSARQGNAQSPTLLRSENLVRVSTSPTTCVLHPTSGFLDQNVETIDRHSRRPPTHESEVLFCPFLRQAAEKSRRKAHSGGTHFGNESNQPVSRETSAEATELVSNRRQETKEACLAGENAVVVCVRARLSSERPPIIHISVDLGAFKLLSCIEGMVRTHEAASLNRE